MRSRKRSSCFGLIAWTAKPRGSRPPARAVDRHAEQIKQWLAEQLPARHAAALTAKLHEPPICRISRARQRCLPVPVLALDGANSGHPSLAERRGSFSCSTQSVAPGGLPDSARFARAKSLRKVQGPRGHLKWDPLSTRKQRSPGDNRGGETRSSRRPSQEDAEVIRMSQWVEVRHLHLVEGVPKKEIARRLKLDVKTVRRAIGRPTPPVRVSPPRPSTLAPWREQIKQWLCAEPRLTAKRIRRLLLPLAGPLPARTVRRYVAGLRAAGTAKEAFVHRACSPARRWRSTSASRGSTSPACRAR